MPTTDERLNALEQFRSETAKHIRSTDENFTILLGVIRDQGIDIKHIFEELQTMKTDIQYIRASVDERFNALNNRLDTIVGSLAVIQQTLDKGK